MINDIEYSSDSPKNNTTAPLSIAIEEHSIPDGIGTEHSTCIGPTRTSNHTKIEHSS